MRSGVRCAETTRVSWGMASWSRASAACFMVGQSEVEPMMMPISGDMADKRPCQTSKVKCQKWCGAGRRGAPTRHRAASSRPDGHDRDHGEDVKEECHRAPLISAAGDAEEGE